MKKFFYFAASALMLMACAKTEELNVNKENAKNDGIKFEVYTQKALTTRGGGQVGDITNANIGENGFGVFAYYTAGEKYDVNAKPNFMYNQQVVKDGDAWKYEPVKYWPNEYGSAAISDEIDYVTFFSYAPYTEFEPTTGEVAIPKNMADPDSIAKIQKLNIISVNKNSATGDPMIKYVVDTDPATSVDLLWGVAANNAAGNYSAINTTTNPVKEGMPFIDLVKPGNPKEDKISFNLKHSLAKVKFTIDYVADAFTPDPTVFGQESAVIDSADTRIFVRQFIIDGWATKGALNLNNTDAGQPLWKDFDGVKDLAFNQLAFNDGRKDGKEGDVNGAQSNEENQGLNPKIVENWGDFAKSTDGFIDTGKNPGVLNKPQLLFGGDETKNGGYFYVIPRNGKDPVNVTIVYDVETIDPKLAGLLSDGVNHGLSIENVISKEAILGPNKDFEAGKQYLIKIHLGMTSVKIEAVVTDWVITNDEDVDLPDNQPMPCWTVDGVPGYFTTDPSLGIDFEPVLVKDETSFNKALEGGPFERYYHWCDTATVGGIKYRWGASGRHNGTEHASIAESECKSAAAWDALGYVRCWNGAKTDGQWPLFGIDLGKYPITADTEVKVTVNGDKVKEFDPAWITIMTKSMANGTNYIVVSLVESGDCGWTEFWTESADPAAVNSIKVTYTFPADKVRKHETKY